MGPVSSTKGAMTPYRCRMVWLDVDSCRGRGMAEERYMSNRGAFVRERIDIEVVFDVESRSPVA